MVYNFWYNFKFHIFRREGMGWNLTSVGHSGVRFRFRFRNRFPLFEKN